MSDFKKNRNLIWELSKNDFKKRYAGSSLGRVWAFVQPLVTVVLYYFVFGLVFPGRSPYDSPVPYVMWLTAGLVPWFFLNEAVTTGANAMNEYNYLVKKVVFPINVLPRQFLLHSFIFSLYLYCLLCILLMVLSQAFSLYSFYIIHFVFLCLCLLLLIQRVR